MILLFGPVENRVDAEGLAARREGGHPLKRRPKLAPDCDEQVVIGEALSVQIERALFRMHHPQGASHELGALFAGDRLELVALGRPRAERLLDEQRLVDELILRRDQRQGRTLPARSRSASKPSRPATPPPTINTLGFELRCPATTRSSYARDERNLTAAKIRLDLCASARE